MVKWTTKDRKKVMDMWANGRTIRDIERITKSDLKEFTSYLSNRIIFCPAEKKIKLKAITKK